MSPRLNQAEYNFFAFTHINPFIFVVGSIFTVVPISHNIRSNNDNPMTTMLYAAELQRCKEIQSIAEQPIWSETETLRWRDQATNAAYLCSRSKAFRHWCCVR